MVYSKIIKYNRAKLYRLIFFLFIFTNFLILSEPKAIGRLNLPQQNIQISITDKNHKTLKKFFKNFKITNSKALNKGIERVLIDLIPENYHLVCKEMISHWGTVAEKSSDFSVRIIFIKNYEDDNKSKQIFLVYRCFSSYTGYIDQFFDERLAVLRINNNDSTLSFLSHAKDCENCSDLSQINLDQIVSIKGEPLVSLIFSVSNENPCCGGPFQYSEERINYYLFQHDGVKQVASVLKHKEEYHHDDVGGDVDIIYDAKVEFQKNPKGDITHIISEFSIKENNQVKETGKIEYIWKRKGKNFKKIIK